MGGNPSNVLAPSGDYHLNITSDTAKQFRGTLRHFLDETECQLVALIERSGAVIANEQSDSAGNLPRADSIGVLSAGLFASTQMMAEQLGEEESPEIFCHGARTNMFVSPVSDEFALLALFPEGVAVGTVRLHARKAAQMMRQSLQQVVRNRTSYSPTSIPAATVGTALTEPTTVEGPFLQFG